MKKRPLLFAAVLVVVGASLAHSVAAQQPAFGEFSDFLGKVWQTILEFFRYIVPKNA